MSPVTGIERRFTHQPMDAGFRAQPAESVLSFKLDGGAFNARHIAGRFFYQFGLKALSFAPAQIHALDHGSPVLRFRAAGAGLNI